MCYALPGPRCSGHTRAQLKEAREAHDENPTDETTKALAEAQRAYDKSPKGIAAIREAGLQQNDSEEAVRLFRQADEYEEERETRLAAVGLLALESVVSAFVSSAQDRVNVPQAYKRSSFISQQGHIGYDDDDIVGSALNSRPERSGYVADLSYEVVGDQILIDAEWSVSETDDARAAMNVFEVNELEPDHRPTPDEAASISKQWNKDFNDNLLAVPDEASEATELGNDLVGRVAENVADAYGYDFQGGEELRSRVISRVEQSIIVRHRATDADLFSAKDALDTWDDLYGND